MAKRFLVRVQLEDEKARGAADEPLHDELEMRGFRRTVMISGRAHRLPRGTYIGLADETGGTQEKAATHITDAMKKTGCTAAYIVVETDAPLRVSNLEPA